MKIVWVFALAAGLLSTQLQAKGAEKVQICHFGGHQGDERSDFEIDPSLESNNTVLDCDEERGEVITISENALPAHIDDESGPVPE